MYWLPNGMCFLVAGPPAPVVRVAAHGWWRATDELACETHWVMEDRVISYLTHARRRTKRLAGLVAETARTAALAAASAR